MRNDQRKELANRVADALPLTEASYNPFLVAGEPQNLGEGDYEYRLVEAGPAVPSDECELPASAVAVRVLWGRNLLHVAHLDPGTSFYVGELEDKRAPCDYFLPASKLGSSRAPVVLAGAAVVPCGATAYITRSSGPSLSLEQALTSGVASPCAELPGAHSIPLTDGTSVRILLDDITVEVAATKKGKKAAAMFSAAALLGSTFLYFLGSFVGHVGLLAAMAMFMPPLGDTSDD